MYMIEITEDKVECLSEMIEKMLKYGGKAMQCVEEMRENSVRGRMGERYGVRARGYDEREDDRKREEGMGYGRERDRGRYDY